MLKTNSVSSTQRKYTVDSFFAGVGGIELGFEQTNKFRVVYANEIDKHARITYKLNNPDIPLDERDIHDVKSSDLPNCDIMIGGFPCQAFSIAGYRKGFEDKRGDLFFEMLKLIQDKQPKAIFIENVKNLVTHDHGNTFKVIREALVSNGYYLKWKVLNSKEYGNIPQNRERIYIIGFKNKTAYNKFDFPNEITLTKTLKDVIDFGGSYDETYYYRKGKQKFFDKLAESIDSQDTVYQWRRKYVRRNKSGDIPTLTANMGTGGHNVPLILTNDSQIRKLTPKETFNGQGYPTSFRLPKDMAKSHLYKQAGNSVTVPVVHRIAENITKALDGTDNTKLNIVPSNKKYVLIYLDIKGRFEGISYASKYFDSKQEACNYAKDNKLKLLNDDEYLKLVQKNKKDTFYMVESV